MFEVLKNTREIKVSLLSHINMDLVPILNTALER